MISITRNGTEFVKDSVTGDLYVVLGDYGPSRISVMAELADSDGISTYILYRIRLDHAVESVHSWRESVGKLDCQWTDGNDDVGWAFRAVEVVAMYPNMMRAAYPERGGVVDHYRCDVLIHTLQNVIGLPTVMINEMFGWHRDHMSLVYLKASKEQRVARRKNAMDYLRGVETQTIRDMLKDVLEGIPDLPAVQTRENVWAYDHQRGSFELLPGRGSEECFYTEG